MTLMRDVIKQVETVIDDDEYPATLDELVVMERILMKITLFHTRDKETFPFTDHAPVLQKDRLFPDAVFDYLRHYEVCRKVPGMKRDLGIPASYRSGIPEQGAGISCPNN
jgi:hypothetical protein